MLSKHCNRYILLFTETSNTKLTNLFRFSSSARAHKSSNITMFSACYYIISWPDLVFIGLIIFIARTFVHIEVNFICACMPVFTKKKMFITLFEFIGKTHGLINLARNSFIFWLPLVSRGIFVVSISFCELINECVK